MQGKKAAVFCTFALSPGKTLDKLTSAVSLLGAEVIGGLALNRGKLEAHSEEFVTRLVDSVPVRVSALGSGLAVTISAAPTMPASFEQLRRRPPRPGW